MLSRSAEALYGSLTDDERQVAMQVFLRLVHLGCDCSRVDVAVVAENEWRQVLTELKDKRDWEIHVTGSGNLVQSLMRHDLVDEYQLLVFPVLVGSGKRLFADGTIPGVRWLIDHDRQLKITLAECARDWACDPLGIAAMRGRS